MSVFILIKKCAKITETKQQVKNYMLSEWNDTLVSECNGTRYRNAQSITVFEYLTYQLFHEMSTFTNFLFIIKSIIKIYSARMMFCSLALLRIIGYVDFTTKISFPWAKQFSSFPALYPCEYPNNWHGKTNWRHLSVTQLSPYYHNWNCSWATSTSCVMFEANNVSIVHENEICHA